MTTNLNELKKELEKIVALKLKKKKGSKKLFLLGLFLGLGIAVTSTVVAVSSIGNHDHFITQFLGGNQERLSIDTTKLNNIDCVRSNGKATDDNSSINNAAACWDISERAATPTNFVGDITYTDKRTGFMWSSGFDTTSADSDVGRTLAEVLTDCTSANIRGFTDWRLPTVSELFEAFHHGLYEVAGSTDEDADGSTTDTWGTSVNFQLWTATANSLTPTSSFQISPTTLSVTSVIDTSDDSGGAQAYSARCVRTAY